MTTPVFPTDEEMAQIGYCPSWQWNWPPLDNRRVIRAAVVAAINRQKAIGELKRRGLFVGFKGDKVVIDEVKLLEEKGLI